MYLYLIHLCILGSAHLDHYMYICLWNELNERGKIKTAFPAYCVQWPLTPTCHDDLLHGLFTHGHLICVGRVQKLLQISSWKQIKRIKTKYKEHLIFIIKLQYSTFYFFYKLFDFLFFLRCNASLMRFCCCFSYIFCKSQLFFSCSLLLWKSFP